MMRPRSSNLNDLAQGLGNLNRCLGTDIEVVQAQNNTRIIDFHGYRFGLSEVKAVQVEEYSTTQK